MKNQSIWNIYWRGLVLLEVILKDSNQYMSMWLTEKQLSEIEIVDTSQITPSENSEDFFFYIEANRIRLAYQFDPLLAVNVSQVDPLPHQIEAVYHYVLKHPKIRFLIADDAGAGKTIMAGLIIKELQYRNLAQRILIVAPSSLKDQWRRELKEKFNLKFKIIDRNVMNALWGENVWEEETHCITSIDFLKQNEIKQSITGVRWDLVIVDEAHKMAAYKYHTKDGVKIEKTDRYKVGEILSKYATHILFLTATPHKGDEENFRLFLDLLKPGFFSKTELLKESVENKENPIFVRRLKEDMKDFKGNNLFPPRKVKTIKFRLTEEEKELYNAVTDYVRNYFDKAREKRSIAFAMMILQRRLTSCVNSVLSSLERRKKRLEELLELPDKIKDNEEYNQIKNFTEDDLEDLEEKERWKIEKKLEHLTLAKNIEDVKIEISQVEKLIEKANKVKALEVESKLVKLRDELLTSLGDRKLLIFTEFKDTLFYLEGKLKEWGYKVNVIHGDMNLDARIKAEYEFKHNTQIMVATEAAGEGINLQFCSLMVNYDIPWNPNRLDQRMGRIHRYLQNKEVFIWNMISIDTIEGQVLDKVFDKLDKMKKSLGSDKVFDIIGELIPDTRLDELLKDAIFSQRRMDEIFQKVEEIDEKNVKEKLEKVFLTSLASHHIDYTGLLKESLQAQENRLVPEYIEDYFLKAFKKFKGKIEKKGNYYAIYSVP
ncbi:MAG: helicase-related protein, partial [Methanosarcinales archaeon]